MLTWEFGGDPPRAGCHYLRNLPEFNRWFANEAGAVRYMTAVRFRGGVACPRCGAAITLPGGPRWWCASCRRWFTPTTATLLERTKVPLATWLLVAWYLVQTKIGVSALSIQRITGVNYATAWLLLQKMRAAMDQGVRDKLSGDIEFDETYVGGVEPGAPGRSRGKKSPVAVACEVVSPTAMGRIRLARLPDASALAIADFLEHNVEPRSVLVSDDWSSYGPALAELGARGLDYEAKITALSKTEARAHVVHPHVHRVASLLKRWLRETHQGAVTDQHLDAYLEVLLGRAGASATSVGARDPQWRTGSFEVTATRPSSRFSPSASGWMGTSRFAAAVSPTTATQDAPCEQRLLSGAQKNERVRLPLQPATCSQSRPSLLAARLLPDGHPCPRRRPAPEATTGGAADGRSDARCQGHRAAQRHQRRASTRAPSPRGRGGGEDRPPIPAQGSRGGTVLHLKSRTTTSCARVVISRALSVESGHPFHAGHRRASTPTGGSAPSARRCRSWKRARPHRVVCNT